MPPLRSILAVLCLAVAGCTLLLDTAEPVQCATNADCDASPALRNRVCSQGFCVNPTPDRPGFTADAGEGCVSSPLCTQGNSNQPSVCRKAGGPCTPIATEQCKEVVGAWDDPNAIFIGDVQPFTTRQYDGSTLPSSYADRVRRAMNLGLLDFMDAAAGGFLWSDGKRRPFALVHCDSSLVPAGAATALKHLTEVVGAQAVIVGADDDLAAITPEATAKQIAIACSDCVGPLPDGPLAWRIGPALAPEAPMVAWRVSKLEEQIKGGPNPPADIKVAILMLPGRATEAFVEVLSGKLQFNGKPALQNDGRFELVKTENPTLETVNHLKHAQTIVAFEPDVIIVVMADDFPVHYLPLIEAKWPAGKRRPHYITTALNFNVTTFLNAITSDDIRVRITGTRPGYTPELQANIDAFEDHYVLENDFKRPDQCHTGYDAFYATAFAILAARVQPVLDGPHIAAGFERLRGGATNIDFRPENIGLATTLLGDATQKLDVRGLWSDLDWNLPSRDMVTDVSMYCFERDSGGNLILNRNAGPHLTTSTGVIDGKLSCR